MTAALTAAAPDLGSGVSSIPGINGGLVVVVLIGVLSLSGLVVAIAVGFRARKTNNVKGAADSAAGYGIAMLIALMAVSAVGIIGALAAAFGAFRG